MASLSLCASLFAAPLLAAAPQTGAPKFERGPYRAPQVSELARAGMREVIEYFEADRDALLAIWDVDTSPRRRARERELLGAWSAQLERLDQAALSTPDQVDLLLLSNRIEYLGRRIELSEARWPETAALLPFAEEIAQLQEGRRALTDVDAQAAAGQLAAMAQAVDELRGRVERLPEEDSESATSDAESDDPQAGPLRVSRLTANRAAGQVRSLRRDLRSWFHYREGYDPLFSWWCQPPFEEVDAALERYSKHLRETVAGVDEDDTDTILGDPIGRDGLLAELRREWIAYTPEELLAIARKELAWCDERMLEASRELGFGEDWRAAQEHVKSLHVAPGEQPNLIRDLAMEAVDFLEARELVTIPDFAKTSWRMEMMSPERQKFTPYFTGGEVISVSFPTASMAYEDKLMSMRGNNVHFSRATVHHELIPGHHLQGFMSERFRPYRQRFSTPFWVEGWALYWEMLLWDEGFARDAADRIGMLFWRKHRCARILFSLGFQLGELSPDECIDMLVERVGHERRNATAEVRRSVQGGYGPLYQAAYMLGGLQLRALHRERVEEGGESNRSFHDALLRQGPIPIELMRAALSGRVPAMQAGPSWRFYDI